MGLQVLVDADAEPISLSLAWAHLRIDAEGSPLASAHDTWLEMVGIPAARDMAEQFTRVAFASKRYLVTLDAFPVGALMLEFPPVTSVVSVEYVDTDGALQVMDEEDYSLDSSLIDPWIIPVDTWPATADVANAVRVTYEAGYDAVTIPPSARAALLLLLGHLFENREDSVVGKSVASLPNGAFNLLQPFRRGLGV